MLEIDPATRFGGMGLITGVLGAIIILMTRGTPARESNSDALAFLLLFWLIVPVIAAAPYVFTGAASSFGNAYFEAVSAVTTTGASTLLADEIPRSLHIWRSLLQWFGGIAAATFAVVILAALNLSGTGVHRSMLFTLKQGELFGRLIGIGRIVLGIYLGLSVLCFIGLLLTDVPAFEALCLSMTSVSTGGLTPRDGPLATYAGPASAMVLAIFCLLGAASIAVLWDTVRLRSLNGLRAILSNVEHRGLLVIVGGLILMGLLATSPRQIMTIIPEAAFFASSAGFDYHVIGLEMLPPALLIAIALIGGSALSTAGGVKIIRLLLLFRHLGTDLNRLSHPSRVVPVQFRGRSLPDRAFLSIWMYFFGYTLVFSLGVIALGAAGLPYDAAVPGAAASLSNMGPLLPSTLNEVAYSDFTLSQQMVSAILMLFGRVEVLAVFAAFSGGIWRR